MSEEKKKILVIGIVMASLFMVLPLILILILSSLNIMQFDTVFIIILMLLGALHVALIMLRTRFPKDSSKREIINICWTLYSGLYFFYMLGGFIPLGVSSYYFISIPGFYALFGLQLFAWLTLIASFINSGYYVMKIIGSKKEKLFQLKDFVRLAGILSYVIIFVFVLSIIISGLMVSFTQKEEYDVGWYQGNPLNLNDDRVNITTYFDVNNQGLYAVSSIRLDAEIYTITTTDATQLLLPDNTKIGELIGIHYDQFRALSNSLNQNITIDIFPQYVPGLVQNNATLSIRAALTFMYAGIIIDLNLTIPTTWTALV